MVWLDRRKAEGITYFGYVDEERKVVVLVLILVLLWW